MKLKDYKKIYWNFDFTVNDLLRCDDDNSSVMLARFKNILDEEEVICSILSPIKDIKFNYKEENFITDEFGYCKINSPVEKKKDLKARYDYLTDIVNENIPTIRLCMDFYRKWDKNAHRKFMEEVFGPLYKFIFNELEIKIDELKRKESSIEFVTQIVLQSGSVYQDIKGNIGGNAKVLN